MVEKKRITFKEMEELLAKARSESHPFYYRFAYARKSRSFVATRLPKDAPASEFDQFNTVEVEQGSPIHRAMRRIAEIQSKRSAFGLSA